MISAKLEAVFIAIATVIALVFILTTGLLSASCCAAMGWVRR